LGKKTGGQKFKISYTQDAVKEYNSTLPSPLVPLPKEMPKEFYDVAKMHSSHGTWQWLLEHYGTPSKEAPAECGGVGKGIKATLPIKEIDQIKQIAQHLHSKYSLPTKQEDVDKLKEELEDERIRHAACGTAALGYFTGCHEKYLSASLQDVINLRLKYEGLLNKQEEEKVFPFNLKEGDKFKWRKRFKSLKNSAHT
jgi:hypothetical protein